MADSELLKKDLFGEISRADSGGELRIVRDAGPARPWVRWLARRLLGREARVLAAMTGIDGVPQLLRADPMRLERSYLAGVALQVARPRDPAYFRAAARLLRCLHSIGVVHNDLAKEPNLLVCDDGSPGFVDFQLGWYAPGRGRLFRRLAYEDLRHLLKHKRTYCPQHLTQRERAILSNPSFLARVNRRTIKPLYLFVTRRLLGWSDREGAGDRGARF
jgi:RIO-like serine/threonine protein kinase